MSADLSRTAGVVAYLLLSAWMLLALAPVRADLRERLGLLALGAVAAHGLFLLPDEWLQTSLTQLLVPFTSEYRPLWTGLGSSPPTAWPAWRSRTSRGAGTSSGWSRWRGRWPRST